MYRERNTWKRTQIVILMVVVPMLTVLIIELAGYGRFFKKATVLGHRYVYPAGCLMKDDPCFKQGQLVLELLGNREVYTLRNPLFPDFVPEEHEEISLLTLGDSEKKYYGFIFPSDKSIGREIPVSPDYTPAAPPVGSQAFGLP